MKTFIALLFGLVFFASCENRPTYRIKCLKNGETIRVTQDKVNGLLEKDTVQLEFRESVLDRGQPYWIIENNHLVMEDTIYEYAKLNRGGMYSVLAKRSGTIEKIAH